MAANPRFVSVPDLAREWGCSQDHILALIHAKKLGHVNLSINRRSKRPRYAIPRDEVERFERARTSGPAPLPTRRPKAEDYERIFS